MIQFGNASLPPAVKVKELRKAFGPCVANTDVSFEVHKGSIQGILGENGAGKTTAMKMLYGVIPPDHGEIWIDGIRRELRSPHDAKALGIGMVHQHFMLSEAQTVLENIVLGEEPTYPALSRLAPVLQLLNLNAARVQLLALMNAHGLDVPLDSAIADLSVGARQRVEILKLLSIDAQILIFDEPTAVLTPKEVERFFELLRTLAKAGKTILIVTHKLRELLAVTDAITIFRAGRVLCTVETKNTDADTLATLMIGARIEPVKNSRLDKSSGQPVLEIADLQLASGDARKSAGRTCSLVLHKGEILGIAGIEGNGQSELVKALRHPREFLTDHSVKILAFSGRDMRAMATSELTAAGLGCVPADRHHEALLLDRSAVQNFLLGYQKRKSFRFGPFVRWSTVRRATVQGMENFGVVPQLPDLSLRNFSGGNQQKLIIAREVHHRPKLLIAVHPTRGVDIGAIQIIHRKLLELKAQGLAILLISSELDEIIALSDRIAVLENFGISKTFEGGTCNEKELGLAMSGANTPDGRQADG